MDILVWRRLAQIFAWKKHVRIGNVKDSVHELTYLIRRVEDNNPNHSFGKFTGDLDPVRSLSAQGSTLDIKFKNVHNMGRKTRKFNAATQRIQLGTSCDSRGVEVSAVYAHRVTFVQHFSC